jgi:hypothetical protein
MFSTAMFVYRCGAVEENTEYEKKKLFLDLKIQV